VETIDTEKILQKDMEEMDFTDLANGEEWNKPKYHVGREVDITLRLRHFDMDILAYIGNKIIHMDHER